jgi:anti-sigma regulatory factor (Ser/Thr protein kinase)
VLATHEAAANAIEHAASLSPIEIRARRAAASIVVEVKDHGRWQPARNGNEDRGRGLGLIEQLVSAVKLETSDDGTTVRLLREI